MEQLTDRERNWLHAMPAWKAGVGDAVDGREIERKFDALIAALERERAFLDQMQTRLLNTSIRIV